MLKIFDGNVIAAHFEADRRRWPFKAWRYRSGGAVLRSQMPVCELAFTDEEIATRLAADWERLRNGAEPPGRKPGRESVKALVGKIAKRRPPRRHGWRISLARMVNTELRTRGHNYEDDSIYRMLPDN